MPLAVAELIYTGFFVEQAGLPDNSPAGMPPGLPFRFLTFLAGRSFVFTNLTALFGNFARVTCYFSTNFVMQKHHAKVAKCWRAL
jgi:hypothetical protein